MLGDLQEKCKGHGHNHTYMCRLGSTAGTLSWVKNSQQQDIDLSGRLRGAQGYGDRRQ